MATENNGEWVFMGNATDGIPEIVEGRKITATNIVSGNVYYDREVKLVVLNNLLDFRTEIKIATGVSTEKVFDYCVNQGAAKPYQIILDLTELDSVVIPPEVIAVSNITVIYVSADVIANYQGESKVQLKQ